MTTDRHFPRHMWEGATAQGGASRQLDVWRRDEALQPVQVTALTVKRGRLVCDVVVRDGYPLRTTRDIAAAAIESKPVLAHHACINGAGPRFGDVIESTSIPHLLEHLIIDYQVNARHDVLDSFIGTTEWVDEGQRHARIEVSFVDDLDVLRAVNSALEFLNSLLEQHGHR